MEEEYKLVLLGNVGVGKSACLIQLINNHFVDEYDPTIEDSYRKQEKVDGKYCVIDILDTTGIESDYTPMHDQYITTGQGFLLLYSIESRYSFDRISEFYEKIQKCKSNCFVPMIVMGNKCDLDKERQISIEEGEEISKIFGCKFIECSAKEQINIKESFHYIIRELRKCNGIQSVK